MTQMIRLPYMATENDPTGLLPRLPLTLNYENRSIEVVALLDTGSAVNVLPYRLGLTLGAEWNEQQISVPLVGSLGNAEAKAITINASHPLLTTSTATSLIFAWTRKEDAPLVLGQVNFFMEFDVCFFRSQGAFEIAVKS